MNNSRIPLPGVSALLICALLLISACTTGPQVRANLSPGAQLQAFRTYGFVAEPGTNRAGYSTPVTGYFKEAIRREMDARGYVYSETSPDLQINFNANAVEKADVQSIPSARGDFGFGYYGYRSGFYLSPLGMYGGADVQTIRYKVGTANVDVVDAARKELLWEGIAEGRISNAAMANPQPVINSAVAEMFLKFPGRATPR
jgi:hypothetical protein